MIEPKKQFLLTRDERDTNLWTKLMAHWSDRLASLRAQNDNSDRNEIDTAKLRGQIAELKQLLALNNDPPDF